MTQTDLNDLSALRQELERTKKELHEKTALLNVLFEENPDGVAVTDMEMKVLSNPASNAYFGTTSDDVPPEEWATKYGIFGADGVTPFELSALPLVRALRGETIKDDMMFVRSAARPAGTWLSVNARPIEGYGAISVLRDVTDRKRLEQDLAARAAERMRLVEQLRAAVDELSVPVLEVWQDVLAAPIVGVLDSQRCARMAERILYDVVARNARYVILDLTGVSIIDTATADHVAKTARAISLLGAQCIVTGVQPQVAQTLVELDADFRGFRTEPSLRRAIEYCIEVQDRAPRTLMRAGQGES